jgi:hypothetical protein
MRRRTAGRTVCTICGIAQWLLLAITTAAAQPVHLPVTTAHGSAQPRLSRTPGGDVVLSWLEPVAETGRTRLRVAVRSGTEAWSAPRTVAEGANWFVNWADVPGVVPVTETTWVAHWLERSDPAARYAYDIRVAISHDGGRTWSAPVTPHTDTTRTEHGFVSVFPWPSTAPSDSTEQRPPADVGLAWLDGREMHAGAGHGGDHGNMTLRAARLAADGSLHDQSVLDSRVCECCPTAATTTSEGVIVAYRNRGDDETRDMHVVRHTGGTWHPDRVAVADRWTIMACPVNGPALTADGRDVVLAWFTAVDDQPRVKVAFSQDAGRTWGAASVVDDGRPLGRVGVAPHPDGGAVVIWIEAEDTGASVRVRRVRHGVPAGRSAVVARVAQSRLSGYPRIVASADGFVLAWVEADGPSTRVVTARAAVSDVP